MYLKPYQVRVAQAIDETLRRLRAEKGKAAPGVNWVETALDVLGLTHRDRCWNGLGQPYPRLVLKIPTGGGKTLLAVEAIRAYQNLFAQKRTGLVVWVVPTETIYTQTVRRLRDKGHHLRQLLDQSSGNRTIILEKGQKLTREDVRDNLVILFVMIQSISRAANKEALKVFQDSGGYEGFFPADHRYDLHAELLKQYPNLDYLAALGDQNPLIKTSLGNAVRVSRPFIVIDEIHKVFSETARAAIDNLNPEMVLGLSATPKREMNLLVSVSGLELKDAEMVKLDMRIYPPAHGAKDDDWQSMVTALRQRRDRLEEQARAYHRQGGVYIRPIALIQVEATGKDQRGRGRVHSLDVKDYLTQIGVNPNEVAIKTSAQNDIEDMNLFSSDCPVRYIITKEALREGWDVSFAYVLGVIPNVQSNTGLTQLIGRILRQPNARKTGVPELDESYVYYSNGSTRLMLERVNAGFKKEGLEDLVTKVQVDTYAQIHPVTTTRIKSELAEKHAHALYLPAWVVAQDEDKKRPFSYTMDIKAALDFDGFVLSSENLNRLRGSLSAQNRPAAEIVFTLDEQSRAVAHTHWAESSTAQDEINLRYLTHRYTEWMENPYLARAIAQKQIALLETELGRELTAAPFSHIAALLVEFLREYKTEREETIFLDLLKSGKLLLAVSDDPQLSYSIPRSDTFTKSREDNPYHYYLFEEVDLLGMNSLERKAGDLLDKQAKILWWFRNKTARNWYAIQGWKEHKIRPDFVAAKRDEDGKLCLMYVLESKGEPLLGNADTLYKKKGFDVMTGQTRQGKVQQYQQAQLFPNQIGEKTEFYFIEQGHEDEEVGKLFQ